MNYYNTIYISGFSNQQVYFMLYKEAFNNMHYSNEDIYKAAQQIVSEEYYLYAGKHHVYLVPYSSYLYKIEICDVADFIDYSEEDVVNAFIDVFDFAKQPSFSEYFNIPPLIVHRMIENDTIVFYTYSDIKKQFGCVNDDTINKAKAALQKLELCIA